jgi:hypothetical protein
MLLPLGRANPSHSTSGTQLYVSRLRGSATNITFPGLDFLALRLQLQLIITAHN